MTHVPLIDVRNFLRSGLTDYNATNRVGSNWVHDDFPRVDLVLNSYPRIGITRLAESQMPNGQAFQLSDRAFSMEIAIWTKTNMKLSPGGPVETIEKIVADIINIFHSSFRTGLSPKYNGYSLERIGTPAFDEAREAWRQSVGLDIFFGDVS